MDWQECQHCRELEYRPITVWSSRPATEEELKEQEQKRLKRERAEKHA